VQETAQAHRVRTTPTLTCVIAISMVQAYVTGCTRIPDEGVDAAAPECTCAGRECGDDGCGGTCGTCGGEATCEDGVCVPGCVRTCSGRECGPDGCGGLCGTCAGDEDCVEGTCVCRPSCAGRDCGPDGCGGTCGTCAASATCDPAGRCACATPLTCYRDADGDGYLGEPVDACGSCPDGFEELADEAELDCLDDPSNEASAMLHPGAWFAEEAYCLGSGAECAAGGGTASFDYDCNGVEEGLYGEYGGPSVPGLCSHTSHGPWSCLPVGYLSTPPPCGTAASFTTCCHPPEPYGDVVQSCR